MGTTSSYQRWEIWEIWASDGIAVGDLNYFTAVPTRSLQRTQASHAAQQSRAVLGQYTERRCTADIERCSVAGRERRTFRLHTSGLGAGARRERSRFLYILDVSSQFSAINTL
eukprot:scaffold66783_cov45-Phaeocystis_antarctica.AAC.1